MAEPIKYAIGPDGRIVNYEPHHQVLKPGWREATEEDIASLRLARLVNGEDVNVAVPLPASAIADAVANAGEIEPPSPASE